MNDRPAAASEAARLITKLETIADLTSEEKDALRGLPYRTRTFDENTDLVRQGDKPPECCLLLEGFVCRYKLLGEGRRQIMSFHIAGDIPDLQSLLLKTMDHSLGSLTPVRVAFIPHAALNELTRAFPASPRPSGGTRSSTPPCSVSGWRASAGAAPTRGSPT